MKVLRRFGLTVLALASAMALTSCGSDSNEPSDSGVINDPEGMRTAMFDLVSILNAGPLVGVRGVRDFAGTTLNQLSHGHGNGVAALIGAQPTVLQTHRYFKIPRLQPGPRSPIGAHGHLVAMGDAIDDSYYTKVFAYNRKAHHYEDNGTNSGPANGVRFVLYNAPGNYVLDPSKRLGFLDVLDQSDQTKSQVGIVVTNLNGTSTYAHYSVTLPDTFDSLTDAYALVASGTLSDGQDLVDFSAYRAQTSLYDRAFNVTLTGPNASMNFSMEESSDPQTEDSHVGLDRTVQAHNETFRWSGTEDHDGSSRTDVIDFTIWANGKVFARSTTFDGSNGHFIWVKDNGQPLTSAEQDLIEAMRLNIDEAFTLVDFTLALVTP